ncbi:VTT domain-containing protein [Dyadobacter tibetensis]|uniref:VTT domain-containing protein n=1 Tax=Dyadobacter tibetensis TaxID=1211851 RepID=UPI001E3E4CC5|nr:VTT domain-containing protein [Dyadobacter tibetensis]
MAKSPRTSIPAPIIISILMTVVPLFATSALTAWAVSEESLVSGWNTQTWLMVTTLLTLTSAVALTPPTFLALVYGYFMGLIAIPYLIALNLCAIGLVYLFALFFDAGTTMPYLIKAFPKVEGLLTRFRANQLRLIFFAKLSPILPFAVTNLFFAIAGARLTQVILGGTLGMIPRTILAVWIGSEAQDIQYLLDHPQEGLASKLITIVLLIISSLGISFFLREKKIAEN